MSEIFRIKHLPNLRLAFPARPVFLVQFHKTHRAVDRLVLRFQFKLRVAADNLLGLRERPVDHGYLSTGKPDTGSQRGRAKSTTANHSVTGLFTELVYLVHQRLGRMARFLARLNNHHKFHRHVSLFLIGSVGFRTTPGRTGMPGSVSTSNISNEVLRNRHFAFAMPEPFSAANRSRRSDR